MKEWLIITLCVSFYASFRDYRPVDSFYTSYLTSPAVNFTAKQVTEDIYPINMYATTSMVLIVFLVTDFIRYKPVVILDAFSSIMMFVFILPPVSLLKAKLAMVFMGLTSASELAHVAYAYAKIRDRDTYQRMTGIVRGTTLLGKCLSSLTAQVAVSYFHTEYELLVYMSLAGSTIAFITTFFFPSVSSSIYFHPDSPVLPSKITDVNNQLPKDTDSLIPKKSARPFRMVLEQLHLELKDAYTNPYLYKYIIWVSWATAVYFQVLMYNDVLYLELNQKDPINNKLYNGGVDALAYITGALFSYSIGFLKVKWESASNLFLFGGSLVCCVSLCVCYVTPSLNAVYCMFVVYYFTFQSMNVVSRSEIAKNLHHSGFAFIFGVLCIIALVISSVLTYVCVQGIIVEMPVNVQVTEDIYPISMHVTTSTMLIVFLVTDFICYKSVLILDAFSSILNFVFILPPVSLLSQKVLMYNDVLYLELNQKDPINNKLYNGGVDALAYITGSLFSYSIGFLKVKWESASNLFLFGGSLVCCVSLCVCYATPSLNAVYCMFVVYYFTFQSMNVVSGSEIAKNLHHSGFAFIFGVLCIIALVISSVLTYVCVQGIIVEMPVNVQFLCYGLIHGDLALWYFIQMCMSKCIFQ